MHWVWLIIVGAVVGALVAVVGRFLPGERTPAARF